MSRLYSVDKDKLNFQIRKGKVPFRPQSTKGIFRYADKENTNANNSQQTNKSTITALKEITNVLQKPQNPYRNKTEQAPLIAPIINKSYDVIDKLQVDKSQQLLPTQYTKRQRRNAIVPYKIEDTVIRIPNYIKSSFINPVLQTTRRNMKEINITQNRYKCQFDQNDITLQFSHQNLNLSVHNFSILDYNYLVGWLIEVTNSFARTTSFETLFLTISILDRYICNQPSISKSDLQLLGSVSFYIASKTVDVDQVFCDDLYKHILHEQFTINHIIYTEQKIIKALNYEIYQETYFTIFDQMFNSIFQQFKQVFLVQLNNSYQYGVRKLLQILQKAEFRSNSLLDVSIACLLDSLDKNLLPYGDILFTQCIKRYCLQAVLVSNNHFQLNINQIEQIQQIISSMEFSEDQIRLKY